MSVCKYWSAERIADSEKKNQSVEDHIGLLYTTSGRCKPHYTLRQY